MGSAFLHTSFSMQIIQGSIKIYFIWLIYFYFYLNCHSELRRLENSNKHAFIIATGILFNTAGVDHLSHVLSAVKQIFGF